eukprot:6196248-Pleurochrysis_carterae.AAC.1
MCLPVCLCVRALRACVRSCARTCVRVRVCACDCVCLVRLGVESDGEDVVVRRGARRPRDDLARRLQLREQLGLHRQSVKVALVVERRADERKRTAARRRTNEDVEWWGLVGTDCIAFAAGRVGSVNHWNSYVCAGA